MRKYIIGIAVIVVGGTIGWGVWNFFLAHPASQPQETAPYVVPALTTPYSNSDYNFSLKLPNGFTSHEIDNPDGNGTTLVFQDAQDNGIQLVITPFDEDTGSGYTLTQERILQDVPDLAINQPQSIEVGNNYTGLAFTSDNPAFDGASREVWFVFHSNLYQISTYARLDSLLKAIFGTWQFN